VRSLPSLDLSRATKEADLKKVRDDFSDHNGVHLEREERRLAYVAITRPKVELLLSGSRWKVGSKDVTKPQNLRFLGKPSPYLLEIAKSGLANVRILQPGEDGGLPDFDSLVNPQPASAITEQWPMDPLGERHRQRLEAAASQVEAEIESFDPAKPQDEATVQLMQEVEALIDDLAASESRAKLVKLPVRIPASRFKDFLKKPNEIAENYRRPMPSQPFAETMKGTLFHSWIESRYGIVSNADQLDDTEAALEELDQITPQELDQLKANFEKSRWAKQNAKDIEVEIQVTFGLNTFICKIDAVFEVDPADTELAGKKIEIVDWKTGKPPANQAEEDERALQLGLYRMAYSQHFGVNEEDIAVCLYYVADDLVVRPKNVLTGEQLRERWNLLLEGFEKLS
jgi:DNA helicase-2/ATP-dependent DNA helicase PcrA